METKRDPVRVLVIDDDSNLSEAILDALSGRGFFASALRPTASSPAASVAGAAAAFLPDVVLLDIVMPVNTEKLVVALRAHPKLAQTVILGCSGHSALADEISQHLDGFLHKPFDTAELVEAVEEAASLRKRPAAPKTKATTKATSKTPAKSKVKAKSKPARA